MDATHVTADAPPLYLPEQVHPKAIIEDLRKGNQLNGEGGGANFFDHFGVTDEDAEFTLPSTIILIRKEAFAHDTTSNSTAPLLLPSGTVSARRNGHCRCPCENELEFVWWHHA